MGPAKNKEDNYNPVQQRINRIQNRRKTWQYQGKKVTIRRLGYVPNRSDKCMWKFERKKRTHLLQKVNPSSLFSFTPDLPWTQLPRLNLSKTSPLFLCFIKKGYIKIVGQPQVKDKNHYENQDIVPLPTQHLAHSYTASLSVVKVKTIPLIASYKTKILIFLAGKPQKKKERRGLQKPPVSYQWTPTVRRVSSSQTLTAELKIS